MGRDMSCEELAHWIVAARPDRRRGWGGFARRLAELTWQQRHALDEGIQPFLRNWTLERLPIIDRICLRMALCELREFQEIPLRVTLNEYIDLAKRFSTEESPLFINAVLDRLSQQFPQKDFQTGAAGDREAQDADMDVDEDDGDDDHEMIPEASKKPQ